MASTQEGLLKTILSKVNDLDLIAGAAGTVKLNGTTAYSAKIFKAVCFSEDSVVSAIADNASGDKDTYFANSLYTAKAGDIIVAHDMLHSGRFTSITLTSGSAVLIL